MPNATPTAWTFCDSCVELATITYYPETGSYHCDNCKDDYYNPKGMTECPNHQGNFDCTPFCPVCEGNQETRITA